MTGILVAVVLTLLTGTIPDGFSENTSLWESIDEMNSLLESRDTIPSDELEGIFRTAVDLVFYSDLNQQMEDLRSCAFEADDFQLLDQYVDRAAPAITILIMGESNAIGVNVSCFLGKSSQESESAEFLTLASSGFYVDGELMLLGTAELPVWLTRTESSAQAEEIAEIARQYGGMWFILLPILDGYYRVLAYETISGLCGGEVIEGEDLQYYREVYSDPYVMHLRAALDSYSEGSWQGILQSDELQADLDRFADYIFDRFVVLVLEPATAGGYLITAISQEKPDRIFTSWIYLTGSGEYQLRDFSENTAYTDEEISAIILMYSGFLADTVYCI